MGWYSKEPVKVITVIARKNESIKIFRIVKEIDPNAFISQSSAIGVYGEGFDVIKGNNFLSYYCLIFQYAIIFRFDNRHKPLI